VRLSNLPRMLQTAYLARASISPTLPPCRAVASPILATNRDVVVDGSNVMYQLDGTPRLEAVVAVMRHIVRHARSSCCVFDANAFHVLREQQGLFYAKQYIRLFTTYSKLFIEAPARTRADDIILANADKCSAIVISNDRFREYASVYPWINQTDRVLRVDRVGSLLALDGHPIPPFPPPPQEGLPPSRASLREAS
jgi:Zc3h12a-like Ribonuclease NYN domain